MPQHWKPLLDRVLIKQDPAPTIDPNPPHLEIPLHLREKYRPDTGIAVGIGPGTWQNGTFCPVSDFLQVGKRYRFAAAQTATRVDHDGQEHLLMREQDVFLVLKG